MALPTMKQLEQEARVLLAEGIKVINSRRVTPVALGSLETGKPNGKSFRLSRLSHDELFELVSHVTENWQIDYIDIRTARQSGLRGLIKQMARARLEALQERQKERRVKPIDFDDDFVLGDDCTLAEVDLTDF